MLQDYPEPLLIKGDLPTQRWKAMEWDIEYLKDKVVEADNVFVHDINKFGPYWSKKRPMTDIESISEANPHRTLNMTGPEFFEKVQNMNDDTVHFWTSNVNNLCILIYINLC